MTESYRQLTGFATGRGRLDEAEAWCLKGIAISRETGDRVNQARCLAQMGIVAWERKEPAQALEWIVKCVTVFSDFPHPGTAPGPALLARLTAQLGTATLEATWRATAGHPLPQAVHDYVATALEPSGSPPRTIRGSSPTCWRHYTRGTRDSALTDMPIRSRWAP